VSRWGEGDERGDAESAKHGRKAWAMPTCQCPLLSDAVEKVARRAPESPPWRSAPATAQRAALKKQKQISPAALIRKTAYRPCPPPIRLKLKMQRKDTSCVRNFFIAVVANLTAPFCKASSDNSG
jgi:hypothetical protein